MTYRSLLISIVVALLLTPVAMASDWPQWRGPERDGTVADGEWPSSLEGLTQNWRIELGESYSGPIVTADRVFTTETHDKKSEIVTAIDRATGKVLWTREWEGAMKVPFFAARNGSWIRSTPAFDGERLIVGGIREVLVALDGDTGEEVWRIDFPAQYGTEMPPFGFVCSPMVDGEFVYVEAAGSFFKLQSATGEVVWRTERFSSGDMMSEGTFSSPVKATIAGREQILVQTRQELKGVDPETGE
ncbi:MAG: PQQ-binding-like beta-propeller repeat protein, partial [Acidobacteriota bacterium]